MKHIGLFEGFGGFTLAAQWMNWETVAWCENNSFCQNILSYFFPGADQIGDIRKTNFKRYYGKIDIITGGFPCQPFSLAGRRAGTTDNRFLWGEMLRAITEISPTWVVAENVRGLLSIESGTVFETVCSDLENIGYEILPFIIPACAVNAPHKRERLWIVAYNSNSGIENMRKRPNKIFPKQSFTYPNGIRSRIWKSKQKCFQEFIRAPYNRFSRKIGTSTYPNSKQWNAMPSNTPKKRETSKSLRIRHCWRVSSNTPGKRLWREGNRIRETRLFDKTSQKNDWENFPSQSPICCRNDGISYELDGITFSKWRRHSIKGFGNAVVPNIPYEIFKCIDVISNFKKKKKV